MQSTLPWVFSLGQYLQFLVLHILVTVGTRSGTGPLSMALTKWVFKFVGFSIIAMLCSGLFYGYPASSKDLPNITQLFRTTFSRP